VIRMLNMNKIHELSVGIEHHLRQFEKSIPALREIKQSLDALKQAKDNEIIWEIRLLREEIESMKTHLSRYGLQEASKYEKQLNDIKTELNSDRWPIAVDPQAICTREDLVMRAEGILDIVISEDVKDRSFLDFGCGEGHVVTIAKNRGAQAIGFDIKPNDSDLITDDFDIIRKKGPYDIILLHDVLDHIEQTDPITIMGQIASITQPNSKIYIRNHPWCARHGSHVYEQTNKAFVHLVLDDVELTRLCGCQADYNIKVTRPLETYRHWFASAGFEIISEVVMRKEVEDFFLSPSHVQQRISKQWEDHADMVQDLEIEFVEYILKATNAPNLMM